MGKIRLLINGVEVEANEGQTVLEAALAADIYIPHICTHPDLPTQGGCGLCVVELHGEDNPVRACQTEVREGMKISTKSERLNKLRSVAMEFMLAGHPHDCTSCKVYLNCELQALMQYLNTVNARLRDVEKENNRINTVNPLIVREMERCIQCGRCVRACRELRGVDILDYNKKHSETYIGTENDLPLTDAGCRFCGACIEVCPTGALQDVEGLFKKELPRDEALIPCSAECPAHIDIPEYVRLVNEGKYSEAVGVIREKVPFPHSLGYVCNHRCETGCKREKLNEAISIRDLKRFAVEHDSDFVWKGKGLNKDPGGKKIAVVGGGSTGLTAAYYLCKLGHDVTVFERLSKAGGYLMVGIPEYRLPKADVQKEIDVITDAGVKIEYNTNITSATDLKAKGYDAVLVAAGTSAGKIIPLPGAEFGRNVTAVEVLRKVSLGEAVPFDIGSGMTVAVLGGGNVAIDVARVCRRLGAEVNVVCLEARENMLSDEQEILEAQEEGIKVFPGKSNIAIEGAPGALTGLRVADVKEFRFEEGRLVVETVPDSEQLIPADIIIFATGQRADLGENFGIEINRFGFPVCDPETLKTSVEGIFAAGDVITGTKFVIDAITGGRRAATVIDRFLGGDGEIDETLVERGPIQHNIGKIDGFSEQKRAEPQIPCAADRMGWDKVDLNFEEPQAKCEAGRCLQCDLRVPISKVKIWTAYANK